MPAYMATEGRMVAALKKIGFDYVFDTNFSADLTIMEEGNELLVRLVDPEEKKMAHVHLLLSGLGKVHEIPVSGNGGSSFHCQITPADVRGNYQELFCGEDGSGSEEDLQYFHHALCFQKDGVRTSGYVQCGSGSRCGYCSDHP